MTGARRGIALLLAAIAAAVACQATPARAAAALGTRFPASFRSWTLEPSDPDAGAKLTLSQLHVPATAVARLSPRADLVVATSAASARSEPDGGSSSSLSGAADVTAQVSVRAAADRLLLQVGVNLPSGKTSLDSSDLAVLGAMAHPLLGFPLRELGQGFCVSAGAAFSLPLGDRVEWGAGCGVVTRGEYTLVDGADPIEPAPELALSAGIDVASARGNDAPPALRLDATARFYGEDEQDGVAIFDEGSQLELDAAVASRAAGLDLAVAARGVLKAENLARAGSLPLAAGVKSHSGDLALVRASAARPIGRAAVGIEAEWRRFRGSDTPLDDGDAFAIGPAFSLPLGGAARLGVRAAYLAGSLEGDGEAGDVDLSGFDVGLGLAWETR
jgi:hypothetical protein